MAVDGRQEKDENFLYSGTGDSKLTIVVVKTERKVRSLPSKQIELGSVDKSSRETGFALKRRPGISMDRDGLGLLH